MNALRAQHMGSDGLNNRVERNDAGADPISQRAEYRFQDDFGAVVEAEQDSELE